MLAVPGDAATLEKEALPIQLSLHGLMRRISRLADDRTFPRQTARLTSLRYLAAVATRLGADKVAAFLPIMLRPLFRITEGLSPNPKEVASAHDGHSIDVLSMGRMIDASSRLGPSFGNCSPLSMVILVLPANTVECKPDLQSG